MTKIFKGQCDEDLIYFYGVDPATVEWITYRDYVEAPVDEVQRLMNEYRLFWCPDEDGKYFLIPRKDDEEDM